MSSFACTIVEDAGGQRLRLLETISSNTIFETIRQVRELISETLRQQAGQIAQLDQDVELLWNQHCETEKAARLLLEPIEKILAEQGGAHAPSMRSVSGSIRNLIAASDAVQVFEALAAEAAQMNVRSAVFEVRGMAAWGSAAARFGSDLSNQDLRSLVVPLNQANPFRLVFETAQALETHAEALGTNRNVVEKLHPSPKARILLLPVHSAEAVTAILYAESCEGENSILTDALRILTEFAGAQLDRLMALSGGAAGIEAQVRGEQDRVPEPAANSAPETEAAGPEPEASPEIPESATPEPSSEAAPEAPGQNTPAPEPQEAISAEPEPGAQQVPDAAEANEEEQQVRRDAQRFSRLLISEIELYNKEQVAEGRRNKDLYQRLKKDIDRSRQTYEKRFGNSTTKQVDYFHEELVKTLAGNDPSLLGSNYPGTTV